MNDADEKHSAPDFQSTNPSKLHRRKSIAKRLARELCCTTSSPLFPSLSSQCISPIQSPPSQSLRLLAPSTTATTSQQTSQPKNSSSTSPTRPITPPSTTS